MGLLDYLPDGNIPPQKPEEKQEEPEIVMIKPTSGKEEKVLSPEQVQELKPAGMKEEDYQAALSVFPPERIRELYSGFDAKTAEPLYEQLFRNVVQAPTVPDEKRIKAARTLANLGDALGLIVQGVAASQGSFIDPQNPAASASFQTGQAIDRLREAYRKAQSSYDQGLLGAKGQDIAGARDRFDKDRNVLLNLLQKMRDEATKEKRFKGEMVYKYERLKGEEAERRERAKQRAEANALGRAKLDLERQKARLDGGTTPRGYLDFYDRNTGLTYRVPERKWKANFSQIFNQIKTELYAQYPLLKTDERFGKLKPADKEEYVKQFMYANPEALQFLEDIAESKFQDGSVRPRRATPEVKREELEAMQKIVEGCQEKQADERETLREISRYLKGQGYSEKDVVNIVRTITN